MHLHFSDQRVENTVGKEEFAHYEQFLLFPQCFQKACFPGASIGVTVWEWVKRLNQKYLYFKRRIMEYASKRNQQVE